MAISAVLHPTRGKLPEPHRFEKGRNYGSAPDLNRAFDFSWWNRGVGKTMDRGNELADRVYYKWLWMHEGLKDRGLTSTERTTMREEFREARRFLTRRAHVWWRRGHRVRRVQWRTQTYLLFSCSAWGEMLYMVPYKYLAIAFHRLMQMHDERAFAALKKR